MKKEMKMEFDALSENESFARVAVAAFLTPLNPTLEEVEDVKTAVSEAVTNCIIHAYGPGYEDESGEGVPKIYIRAAIEKERFFIEIQDMGIGIENIEQAMEPLFTTRPEQERAGMGFAVMEAFMDSLFVESIPKVGTTVKMEKICGYRSEKVNEE